MLLRLYKSLKKDEKYIRTVVNQIITAEIFIILQSVSAVGIFVANTEKSIYSALVLGILTFVGFYFLWQVLLAYSKSKFQEQFVGFISHFISTFTVTGNTVTALKRMAPLLQNPLETIVLKNLYLYEKGLVTYEEMFRRMSEDIGLSNYTNFLMLIYWAEESGANLVEVASRILAYETEKQKIRNELRGSVVFGIGLICTVVVVGTFLVSNALKTPEIISQLTIGTLLLPIIGNIVALWIGKTLLSWLEE